MKCVKYTVFITNLIIWAAGLALLALALLLRFYDTSENFSSLQTDDGKPVTQEFYLALYILIGASGLMTLVGFLGCCGASQENQCMLGTYFFFVLLILIAEIGAVVFYIVKRDAIEEQMDKGFAKSVSDINSDPSGSQNKINVLAFKGLMRTFQCCGRNSPDDFTSTLPRECCADNDQSCTSTTPGVRTIGCKDAIRNWLETHLYITMGVIIGIVVMQVLGLVLSMLLCCRIRQAQAFYC